MLHSKEVLIKITELRNLEFSIREIGEYFNRSHFWVSTRLREIGLSGRYYGYFKPTDKHRDLLVGTTLGDGNLYLRKGNARLRLKHSSLQKGYLAWKVNQFGSLFDSRLKKVEHYSEKRDTIYLSWRCYSRNHPWLTEWHRKFYPEGKKVVTEEILSHVNDLALAIWWCDDGTTFKQPRFIGYSLCTGNLTSLQYELIYSWLSSQGFDPYPTHTSGNGIVFRFRKEGSILFRKRIEPYIPESMLFKFNRHLDQRYLA